MGPDDDWNPNRDSPPGPPPLEPFVYVRSGRCAYCAEPLTDGGPGVERGTIECRPVAICRACVVDPLRRIDVVHAERARQAGLANLVQCSCVTRPLPDEAGEGEADLLCRYCGGTGVLR